MRELLRAVLLAAGGSAVGIAFWAGVVKLIAVIAGPAGVGMFSLLRQLQQSASTVSLLNGQAAVIQGLSARQGPAQQVFWREALRVLAGALVLTSLALLIGAPWIASLALGRTAEAGAWLVRALVPAVVLLNVLNLLMALLSSRRALGWIAIVQGVSGLGALLFAWPAAVAARDGRAAPLLWLLAFSAGGGVLAALAAVRRTGGLPAGVWRRDTEGYAPTIRREFITTSLTLLATGGLTAVTPLIVRVLLARGQGLVAVGYFDAAWTIGVTFIMLLLAAIHAYYLPTLSRAQHAEDQRRELARFFRFSLLLTLPALAAAQLGKPLLVRLLYSSEFAPALAMLRWMLLGDYLLVAGWMLSLPLLVFGRLRDYFVLQVGWSVGFIATAAVAAEHSSWMGGIGAAFGIWHGMLFVGAVWLAWRHFGLNLRRDMLHVWLPGQCGLLLVAVLGWRDTSMHWMLALGGTLVALGLTYFLAGRPAWRPQTDAAILPENNSTQTLHS